MAANYTPNLRLNQWTSEDPVLREDFNSDNRILDHALDALNRSLHLAGNARVEFSSYMGSGGSQATLSFSDRPAMVLVMGADSILIPGFPTEGSVFHSGGNTSGRFRWKVNTVVWNTPAAGSWCNAKGQSYSYLAIFSTGR